MFVYVLLYKKRIKEATQMKNKEFEILVEQVNSMKDGTDEKERLLVEMQNKYEKEFDAWIKEIS